LPRFLRSSKRFSSGPGNAIVPSRMRKNDHFSFDYHVE
jgi:hypothetical protein